LILTGVTYVAFKNLAGEANIRKMYTARNARNDADVIIHCKNAVSQFYSVDPYTVPLYWYAGNSFANMGNYKQALEYLSMAYKVHPFNHLLLNDLGSAFFMNGDTESAIEFYKKAAQINPRFDDPKLNLASIYISKGDFGEAARWNESLFHDSGRREYYRELINERKRE